MPFTPVKYYYNHKNAQKPTNFGSNFMIIIPNWLILVV